MPKGVYDREKAGEKIQLTCLHCGKIFTYPLSHFNVLKKINGIGRKFCSKRCHGKYIKNHLPAHAWKKGDHPSPKTEIKKGDAGEKSLGWRGGKSTELCTFCGKKFSTYSKFKKKYCSLSCVAKDTVPGRIISKKTRIKIGLIHKGMRHSEATKYRLSVINLGKKLSVETKKRIGDSQRGNKNWNWKGGKTPIGVQIRRSHQYIEWRDSVFNRDKFSCVECGVVGGKLQAHHIKPFATHPKLRFDTKNGITLCVLCHKKTDSYLNNKKIKEGLKALERGEL